MPSVPVSKGWKPGSCSTRTSAINGHTTAGLPTVSCPTAPVSAASPSALFQTLNAKYATATWEGQIEQAASLWESVTNVNLALVSDGGEAVGTSGDQQDDPRFGDIRIGAVPLPSGVLAETFLPPPANGGTDAGDILFNSTVNWQINSNYDLMTVAAHEFGHALGLGESSVSTAVMYGTYNGIKQALTSDDIAGIDSIYGTRQFDQFNNGGTHNSSFFTRGEHQLVHHQQCADRHPQPGHHDGRSVRMVLRQRAVHHHGDDDRHGAVEQLELARPQSSGLQLQSEPGRAGLGAQHVRGDDQPVDERGVGSGLLRQGHGRGRARTDRRLRLAAQLRQPDAVADPAPQHGRASQPDQGGRHRSTSSDRRRCERYLERFKWRAPRQAAPDFATVGTLSGWVEDMTISADAVPGQPVANGAATQSDDSGSTTANQDLSSTTTSTTQNGVPFRSW